MGRSGIGVHHTRRFRAHNSLTQRMTAIVAYLITLALFQLSGRLGADSIAPLLMIPIPGEAGTRVVECMTMNHESHMLLIHLRTMSPLVSHWVIGYWSVSHSGRIRNITYSFAPLEREIGAFGDRMTLVRLDRPNETLNGGWEQEYEGRERIFRMAKAMFTAEKDLFMQLDPDEVMDRRLVEEIRRNPPATWAEYPFREYRHGFYYRQKGNRGFRTWRPLRVVRRPYAGSYRDLSGNQWPYNASDPPRFWAHHCSYCWPYINMTQWKTMTMVDSAGRDVSWICQAFHIVRVALCRDDVEREDREMVDLDIPQDGTFDWLWKRQPYVDWAAHGLTWEVVNASLSEECRSSLPAGYRG